jgi:P22 coat protein - gene protein 5
VSFTTTHGAVDATTNPLYTIVEVDTVAGTILLDRPLDLAVTSGDAINYGPAGQFNLAFHRNSMSLVVRPLAMPRAGTGALSAVVNHNDLSMRATITYNGTKQGHLVTLDMLCGIAILDTNLGAVLLG